MELSLLARCKGETRDERRVLLSDCVTEATGVRSQWCSPKSSSARAEHSWGQAESLLLCSEGCRSAMGSAGDTGMWFRRELDNCDLKGSSSLTATPLAPKLFVCLCSWKKCHICNNSSEYASWNRAVPAREHPISMKRLIWLCLNIQIFCEPVKLQMEKTIRIKSSSTAFRIAACTM